MSNALTPDPQSDSKIFQHYSVKLIYSAVTNWEKKSRGKKHKVIIIIIIKAWVQQYKLGYKGREKKM